MEGIFDGWKKGKPNGYITPDDGSESIIVWKEKMSNPDSAIKGSRISFKIQEHDKGRSAICAEVQNSKNAGKDDSIYPPRHLLVSEENLNPSTVPSASTQKKSQVPRSKFHHFAYIPDFKLFSRLAQLALPEQWTFSPDQKDAKDPAPLLRNYVQYTFVKLDYENKIEYSKNGKHAAFNTGLVDTRYNPIIAFFSLNHKDAKKNKWVLDDFCIPGVDYLGKKLVSNFKDVPDAANYFQDPSNAIYDINRGAPQVNWEHVILDNVDRIPIALLRKFPIQGFEPRNIEEMEAVETNDYKRTLEQAIRNDPDARFDLENAYKNALEISIKKVRWNYKTAIPIYFPKENTMSLLIPLALTKMNQVDATLVVQSTASGAYQGHTQLPLKLAYSNARLVCRPDSDWLSVGAII